MGSRQKRVSQASSGEQEELERELIVEKEGVSQSQLPPSKSTR